MLTNKDHSSSTNNHKIIKQKALINAIRFAQITSYCSLIVASISTMIIFYGIVLVLQGQITSGTLTSISSFLATNGFIKISAAANRRVDRLLKND
jgi:ABC-type bacteriocin/lantibiotic exporter with double-glycine peptidase domain